jgi:tetraacyldisaccharide 4'-kinase
MMSFKQRLLDSWQHPTNLTLILWPLSQLYRLLFYLRRAAFNMGLLKSFRAPVPVIVVGNITVGGSGKTPLLISLVELLKKQRLKPGVISRGYSGNADHYPLLVTAETDVQECGDEPALIVKRCAVPMVVGPNRRLDIELLLASHEVNVIISDDGLQHHALCRNIEICIIDKTGNDDNYYQLPAGPYRESVERLSSVDIIVEHLSERTKGNDVRCTMALVPSQPVAVGASTGIFDASLGLHAVAGIGKPQRFFDTCRSFGWEIETHSFNDHHRYSASDLDFGDDKPILMTEKDAVKCKAFARENHWYLPVVAKHGEAIDEQLLILLKPHPPTFT